MLSLLLSTNISDTVLVWQVDLYSPQEEADDEERHKLLESVEHEAMDDVEKVIQRKSGVAGFFMDTRVRLEIFGKPEMFWYSISKEDFCSNGNNFAFLKSQRDFQRYQIFQFFICKAHNLTLCH